MRRYVPYYSLPPVERQAALDRDLEVVDDETRRLLKELLTVLAGCFDHFGDHLWVDPAGARLMDRLLGSLPDHYDLAEIILDEAALRNTGQSAFLADEIAAREFGPALERERARKSTKH